MWSERYNTEDYVFGTKPAQVLVDQKHHLIPGQKALVVADGEGRNSTYLAQLGLEVTAMDSAETGLAKARNLAALRGVAVTFIAADLAEWNWAPNTYDLVVGIFIQFAPPAFRHTIFQGIKRTLKPGGLILLHGFTPEQLGLTSGGPKQRENLYTPEMLQSAFADFEILRLSAYDADLDEGPGHNGPAALIDLIARKPA